MVRGVLLYRMDQQFAARAWGERKQLRSLDVSLALARQRWTQLQAGRQSLPIVTGDFAWRVSALQQRIDVLQARLAAAEVAQSRSLAELAVRDLEQQKRRLRDYRVQAQFALATLYDQAAHAGDNSGAAPSPKGPSP